MAKQVFQGIELLPETTTVKQLFILLHGAGARSSDLVSLANKLRGAFPSAAFLLPDGTFPFDGGGNGRQWFLISEVTEENRVSRVAEAIPALLALVRHAQDRFKALQSHTALVGFSQSAIIALEVSVIHDGTVGSVLAFSGRFAKLPEKAPELTSPYAAYERLLYLQGDATPDAASSVGHELHAALSHRAIHRLQTCIPLRTWRQALNSA